MQSTLFSQYTILHVVAFHGCSATICEMLCLLWLQITIIDAEAMVIGLVACFVPPLAQLNRHKPADRLCKAPTLVLLFVMVVSLQCIDIAAIAIMATRPWFDGGNGTSRNVSSCCCDAPGQITARLMQGTGLRSNVVLHLCIPPKQTVWLS